MEKNKEKTAFIPIHLRGHKTQDEFEYEEIFGFFVLGNDQNERPSLKKKVKDCGDSAVVGELGD